MHVTTIRMTAVLYLPNWKTASMNIGNKAGQLLNYKTRYTDAMHGIGTTVCPSLLVLLKFEIMHELKRQRAEPYMCVKWRGGRGGQGGGGGGGGGDNCPPPQLALKRGRQNDDRGAPAAKQITRNVSLIKMIIYVVSIMLETSSSIANVGDRRKEGGISPHVIYIYSICYVIVLLRR